MPEVITDNLGLWSSALLIRSTAGRGSNNKLEAYGIKKLRELILELAVRGKLVPQDANDEPASALLPKVLKENSRLFKERNKKQNEAPEITDGEITFHLPKGWEYVRNGSLFSLRKGKKPTNISESEIGLPYLDIEALDRNNVLRFTDDEKCPRATEADILVVCDGSRSGLVLDGKNGVIGSTLAVIDTPKLIQPFIKLLFMESYERMNSTMKGAAIPHLDTNHLILEVVGLPPLNEQHRIVVKVDELMALCDQLEQQQTHSLAAHQTLVASLLGTLTSVESQQEFSEAWARIASHFDTLFTTEASIDQLKQTILQLAVMGKLVAQDPNDEPASVLLKRISKEKTELENEGQIKKQKTLPAINEGERLYALPDGWEWVRFGELIQSFTNGLYKKESFYSDTGVISLRMYNIQSGVIDFAGVRRVNVTDYELTQYALEPGDLLINRVNSKELVGKTAIIPECTEPLLFESMNMRAKPYKAHLDSEYLNLYMKTEIAKIILLSHAKEAISQASLNQGQISSLPVPLPPKNEQHHIVSKLDELMALCDTLKARLAEAQDIQLHLADAIVEQAVC